MNASVDILARVWQVLRQHGQLDRTQRLLLAVSGGADSLCLLHTLHGLVQCHGLSVDLVCVHLNHQLRGPEADADACFVRDQVQARGLTFVSERLPVAAVAADARLSMETAARLCRLKRLTALAQRHGSTVIATGHHRDDNAETVLFRLLRGTGYRGLAGIHPARVCPAGVHWIRPLLNLTRQEIHAYLRAQGLAWREDPTNRDTRIKRNFIRHRLLPALEPAASLPLAQTLADLADAAFRMQRRVASSLVPLWTNHTDREDTRVSIERDTLRDAPPWLRAAWLQKALDVLDCGQQNINQDHYRRMEAALAHGAPPVVHTLPEGLSMGSDGSRFVLRRAPVRAESPALQAAPIAVPGTTPWGRYAIVATLLSTLTQARTQPDPSPACLQIEHLDADTLRGPLRVRQRGPGDRFFPLGGSGTRKVGKFLRDCKLTRAERDQVAVLTDREKIVWVAPLRLSEEVRLTGTTQRVLQLELRIA